MENKQHKTTILDRFKCAVQAFKDKPVSTLHMGVEVKRCDECDRVAVVRCGECGYYRVSKEGYGYCMGLPTEPAVGRDPLDYCSKGIIHRAPKGE